MNKLQPPEHSNLPTVETNIVGLPLGVVNEGPDGRLQAYFGGEKVDRLTPYDTAELRDGAIQVDMFTIDGREDTDYAKVTINPPFTKLDRREQANYKGRMIRGMGGDVSKMIERTPVQQFICGRGFMDIPISGRARWLALNPEGKFSTGIFDDHDPDSNNSVAMFGQGWTFAWIVQSTRPFVFGELCSPRFIDQTEFTPKGEDGIRELNSADDLGTLPPRFQELLRYYESGDNLRAA